MSDRAMDLVRRAARLASGLTLPAMLLISLLVTPSLGAAQSAAELLQQARNERERVSLFVRELDSLQKSRTLPLDDSVVVAGRLVRFTSSTLPASERARWARCSCPP